MSHRAYRASFARTRFSKTWSTDRGAFWPVLPGDSFGGYHRSRLTLAPELLHDNEIEPLGQGWTSP